jgi:hypothetical protein
MKSKTSFREKMLRPSEPRIVEEDPGTRRFGSGRMLIPTPRLIEAEVQTIAEGQLMRLSELRSRLAAQYGADFTCPLTTGIFLRIVAEAAEEARTENPAAATAPWWRLVRDDGMLIDKFPGAWSLQADRLQQEGHRVGPKGRGKLAVIGLGRSGRSSVL